MGRLPKWGWIALVAFLLAYCLIMFAVVWQSPAEAQQMQCPLRAEQLAGLAERHQERLVLSAVVTETGEAAGTPAALLDVTASESGAWTMLTTHPQSGRSCVILSGGGLKIVLPGKDA